MRSVRTVLALFYQLFKLIDFHGLFEDVVHAETASVIDKLGCGERGQEDIGRLFDHQVDD